MISWFREYTIQTVFVALQATIIVYGILVTATLLKGNGYPEWGHFSWISLFVRRAGLLFFVIPAGWVWLSIWYDRSSRLHPLLFTVGTGVAALILLHLIFSASVAGTYRSRIIADPYPDLHATTAEQRVVANLPILV